MACVLADHKLRHIGKPVPHQPDEPARPRLYLITPPQFELEVFAPIG